MISCRQSTEWVIKKEQGKLSVKENLQLLSHLAICSFCRLFAKQSKFINKAFLNSKNLVPTSLSPAEKEELRQFIITKTDN